MTNRRIAPFAAAVLSFACVLSMPLMRAQETTFTPQGMEALGSSASLRNDFTLDQSMLGAASQMMPDEDRPIIAKLRSISIHNFRYSAAGYDPATLDAVRAQFVGNGWNHLVTKQTHPPVQTAAQITPGPDQKPFDPTRTDVWVRMANANFDGMVLLVANSHNVNLVVIDGMISPLDLLHLRGHLGIPRFGGDLEAGSRE